MAWPLHPTLYPAILFQSSPSTFMHCSLKVYGSALSQNFSTVQKQFHEEQQKCLLIKEVIDRQSQWYKRHQCITDRNLIKQPKTFKHVRMRAEKQGSVYTQLSKRLGRRRSMTNLIQQKPNTVRSSASLHLMSLSSPLLRPLYLN